MKWYRDKEQTSKLIMAVVFAICAFLPRMASTYTTFLLTKVLLFALLCMQYVFLAGYGGMTSFAHISFYGICAYVLASSTVLFKTDYYSGLLLAFFIVLTVVCLYGLIAVRTSGKYFMMMSIAFCQLVYLSAVQWVGLTRGINGIVGVKPPVLFGLTINKRETVFYFTLIIVALCYFIEKRIISSSYGIALQGVRDNATKMAALGYNSNLQRYVAIVLSAVFSAIAGWISVVYYKGIAPESISTSMSIVIIFVCIIGGTKKLEGAFVGSLVYVILEDYLSNVSDRYKLLIGIFFVLVVLFMDRGILGINVRKLFRRRTKTKSA